MCVLQDYSNSLQIKVRGQATLKLITEKPTIKMDSQTNMVKMFSMTGIINGDDDDGFYRTVYFLVVHSGYRASCRDRDTI